MKVRSLLATLTILFGLAGLAAGAATSAYAGTGNQWCNDPGYCPNAWNGGPFVKSYGYPAANNDFTVIGSYGECNNGFTTSTCPGSPIPAGLPIVAFEYTNGGRWAGQCIGDAYNNSGRADSSLDPCPGGSNGNGGWGVNFVQHYQGGGCGTGTDLFYNIHWGGYLRWDPSGSNGATVYLNNSTGWCLRALPPA